MKILLSILLVLLLVSCSASTEPSEASSDLERELSVGFESSSSASESEKSSPSFSDESSSESSQSESEKSSLGSSSESSSVSKLSESSFEPQFDLNEFTKNYYRSCTDLGVDLDVDFYRNNKSMLEGQIVDPDNIVRIYETADLNSEENLNDFIEQYRSGKSLSEIAKSSNRMFALIHNAETGSYSTAMISEKNDELHVGMVFPDDGGAQFAFPNDKKVLTAINKLCDVQNISCRFVIFTGVSSGILVSDGDQELFIADGPSRCFSVEPNTVFTADEFVEKLIKEKDSIIQEPIEFEVNEDGEIDVVVG